MALQPFNIDDFRRQNQEALAQGSNILNRIEQGQINPAIFDAGRQLGEDLPYVPVNDLSAYQLWISKARRGYPMPMDTTLKADKLDALGVNCADNAHGFKFGERLLTSHDSSPLRTYDKIERYAHSYEAMKRQLLAGVNEGAFIKDRLGKSRAVKAELEITGPPVDEVRRVFASKYQTFFRYLGVTSWMQHLILQYHHEQTRLAFEQYSNCTLVMPDTLRKLWDRHQRAEDKLTIFNRALLSQRPTLPS